MEDCAARTASDFDNAKKAKQATIAAVFIMFLIYLVAAILSKAKSDVKIGVRMRRFMDEFAYRNIFFFLFMLMVHVLVPKPFPVVMIYFYFAVAFVHTILHVVQSTKMLLVTYIIQALLVFALGLSVLIDDWCFFFNYREGSRSLN